MLKKVGSFIKQLWTHPLVKNINIDDPGSIAIHRQLIKAKPLLRSVYVRWYREILSAYNDIKSLNGDMIEIGSGAGFLEELIPGLIKTDVVSNPFASKTVDAMKLDFADGQLKAIFVVCVLHHLPDPERFLAEAQRCLKPGGRLVMVEPNNSWVERMLCKMLDHYEYFDDTILDWKNNSENHMLNANLAIPWVIFVRDRAKFEDKFPRLKIRRLKPHTFLSYFVSGGMTFRSFVPSFAAPLVNGFEEALSPVMKWIGTQLTIDIEKNE